MSTTDRERQLPPILESRLPLAVEKATDAFYKALAEEFPEVTSGDVDPLTSLELERVYTAHAQRWMLDNLKAARPVVLQGINGHWWAMADLDGNSHLVCKPMETHEVSRPAHPNDLTEEMFVRVGWYSPDDVDDVVQASLVRAIRALEDAEWLDIGR